MDPFKTVYKGDYIWPYIAPLVVKPSKPPEITVAPGTYGKTSPLDKKLCHCDRHSWSPHFQRARYLRQKEKAYRDAMIAVAAQRTILENEIIEHPCTNAEDVLASMYKLSYAKEAFPVTEYRAMKADHDDPVVTPVAMLKTALSSGYRDPSNFRKVAFARPDIGGPKELTFHTRSKQETVRQGLRTEYEDSISQEGFKNLLATQQFMEPYPSTRKR